MTRGMDEMHYKPGWKRQSIVYGAFKGMGDLLSAASVIALQLDCGHEVWLLCFPGKGLPQFVDLIDFGQSRSNLRLLMLPVAAGLGGLLRFFREASRIAPDLIWISPHAPRIAASWKIPLLLWATRNLYWPGAQLAGATTERLSILFDRRVPVDRSLPLADRERVAFSMIWCEEGKSEPRVISFIDRVSNAAREPPEFDLLIHPGANARNRSWPSRNYADVVASLPARYRIAVLGLPEDVAALRQELPADRGIAYLTGSLEEAMMYIARSRVVLTMDSGNVHFAGVLGVRTVALFGKSDPATILASDPKTYPIYQRRFPCQPCERTTCNQSEVYCMNSILPATVAEAVIHLLDSGANDRR